LITKVPPPWIDRNGHLVINTCPRPMIAVSVPGTALSAAHRPKIAIMSTGGGGMASVTTPERGRHYYAHVAAPLTSTYGYIAEF
jgi:hypothetical protein